MDIETKLELIRRPPTEEIITEQYLRELLETNDHPKHYIGFEISGFLHLGTLILSGMKINDFIKAGLDCTVYLADWHSFINNKLGRDWDKIQLAAKYYEEAFKFLCPGIKVVNGSDLYHNNDDYWKNVIKFSTHMTLQRSLRSLTIMGRSEKDKLDLSQFFYPPMQAVDINYLGKDVPHGGSDQRKAHVLAREIFPKLGWKKPVPIHHHLLMGLSEPPKFQTNDKLEKVIAAKMSKSKPWTAIFIHDTEDEIKEKLKKAWCPEKQAEMNPVLELVKYLVFGFNNEFKLERPSKFGGNKEFQSYKELETDYEKGKIHPVDLKNNVAREINEIVSPARKHFEKSSNKKLLEVYKDVEITR